ncbi:MAG: hypothetical protein JNM17_04020 [Archangium sp.]|nr:hypothetical protein [Archangium sp.]
MTGIQLVSAERFPHGSRSRYVKGCRCEPCTVANREYAKGRYHAQKAGLANGLVKADDARAHLALLRRCGVGLRTVADVAGIGRSVLQRITRGLRARADVVRRVLDVGPEAAGDGAYVPASRAWSAVGKLLNLGLTRGEIAQGIGRETAALQLGRRRITRRNEHEILKLLEEVRAANAKPELCTACGTTHEPERRREWLKRVAQEENDLDALQDERSCWYPKTEAGRRALMRDLDAIGAQRPRRAA